MKEDHPLHCCSFIAIDTTLVVVEINVPDVRYNHIRNSNWFPIEQGTSSKCIMTSILKISFLAMIVIQHASIHIHHSTPFCIRLKLGVDEQQKTPNLTMNTKPFLVAFLQLVILGKRQGKHEQPFQQLEELLYCFGIHCLPT